MTNFIDEDDNGYAQGQAAGSTEGLAAMLSVLIDFLASAADDPTKLRLAFFEDASERIRNTAARATTFDEATRRGFIEQATIRARLLSGLSDFKQN